MFITKCVIVDRKRENILVETNKNTKKSNLITINGEMPADDYYQCIRDVLSTYFLDECRADVTCVMQADIRDSEQNRTQLYLALVELNKDFRPRDTSPTHFEWVPMRDYPLVLCKQNDFEELHYTAKALNLLLKN